MQSLKQISREWSGRFLKATRVPNPAVGRGTFHWFSKLLTPSAAQSLTLPAAFALQLGETLNCMFS